MNCYVRKAQMGFDIVGPDHRLSHCLEDTHISNKKNVVPFYMKVLFEFDIFDHHYRHMVLFGHLVHIHNKINAAPFYMKVLFEFDIFDHHYR